MGVGAGLYMYVVVVQKFMFAISSPDEFLLFMAALCNSLVADIIFLPCDFYLLLSSSFFFPCLISAVGDWMSTILPHMVWP